MRRLKKRAQFLKAARGKKIARRGFVLQAVAVADPVPGVGYTVTKKTGNAPERNRIKRRLREAVRASSDRLVPGHDYVLIGRRESLTQPFDALTRELGKALERVHIPQAQAPSGHPKP
ncbi:ribonuclease P protein component [Pelagibacterium sp. 26DY04]|uniref:ribonuclease P protein component n=1 Tax=unclassified Pelagibacterium TaxID=2623280 RepID=UPI002815916B|nr:MULTISPECIES: ribonuclease P protein component [unclassified Pelagibacterium]WMT87457.1 ribonuclease P protein component [Pelagibacterium sp. 26DY04]WMT92398.1 ribonuclease P protein component [Pelagibacterium sp. H642]